MRRCASKLSTPSKGSEVVTNHIHKLTDEIRECLKMVGLTEDVERIVNRCLYSIDVEAETITKCLNDAFNIETETLERLGWTYESDRERDGWRAPSGRFFELAECQLDVIGSHVLECAAAQLVALKGGR